VSGEGDLVKDIMKTDVITIESSASIKEAADKMDKANIGSIIVTDNQTPVGIVTERDFVRRYAAQEKVLSAKISEIMSAPLITTNQDETIWEAAELMKTKNIHKLSVTEGKNIRGMVSNTDIVKVCSVGSDSEIRRICDHILRRSEN
jgi:signal-transduction protein with cAMP-binding, CBS, and nucleotidyltransferase domain